MGMFGVGMGMIPALDPGFLNTLDAATRDMQKLAPEKAAADEQYWKVVREAFDYPRDFINLENGYFSPQPLPVLHAYLNHLREINHRTSHFMRRELATHAERVRKLLAEFCGLDPEEVAFTRNTTESLDILISGMDLKQGDEVIVTEYDYGSMLEAFYQQEKRYGIKVKMIRLPLVPKGPQDFFDPFYDAITLKTRVMLVTHLINLNGMVLPVNMLAALGKKNGIAVIVDAAHSFAHLDMKVGDLNAEYLGTSLHKWLSCPMGNGMLHIKKNKIAEIWPLMGDVEKDPTDIRKFEHQGTRPPAAWMAIEKAIEFHNQIGSERKYARLHYLKSYWTERVKEFRKVTVNTPLREKMSGAIAHVSVKGYSPQKLADYLLEKHNIFTVAVKRGDLLEGVRVTPHLYNTPADLDALVRALEKA